MNRPNRVAWLGAWLLAGASVAACEQSVDVGDDLAVECENFEAPLPTDCTAGNGACDFGSCTSPLICNRRVNRCFAPSSRCVGTPCTFDDDCAVGEACSNTTALCFALAESQRCMPCIADRDCGGGKCVYSVLLCD